MHSIDYWHEWNICYFKKKAQTEEEEEIIYGGMFHEETMQFEAIKIDDDDSENELHGDELDVSMDTFLLEHFADENWLIQNGFLFFDVRRKTFVVRWTSDMFQLLTLS